MPMPTVIPDDDLIIVDPSELIKDEPFVTKIELIDSDIAGLMYAGDPSEIASKLKVGDILTLVREPDNQYDRYAVRVLDRDGKKIGYIQRRKNQVISNLMDAGKNVYAKVKIIDDFYGDVIIKVTVIMDDI